MQHILIVEDDNDINLLLTDLLKTDYKISSAFSGTEALLLYKNTKENFDLMILDLMLPGKNGEDVITEVRKTSGLPIIVITAKGDTQTLVSVLEMGADDYISKPFDTREVKARVQSHLRKSQFTSSSQKNKSIHYQNIRIDSYSREVFIEDTRINLTQKEFDLLFLFINEPKRVFTKQVLYTTVWGEEYYGDDNTINVHISRLRSKFKKYLHKDIIETIWSVGFRLNTKN